MGSSGKMSDHYNEIMPESDDRVLCVKITKPITEDGYKNNFLPRIDAMIEKNGHVRFLVWYHAYKGWEENAARKNMLDTLIYAGKIKKIALVNPPESRVIAAKIKTPMIGGELEIFSESELNDALDWVRL